MTISKRKISPRIWAYILLGFCAIGWAVSELSGLANKSAADSGLASADMEMSSLETIRKPAKNPPPVDWTQEARLRKELERLDDVYKKVAANAQKQSSQGVDKATSAALLAAADKFKATSDQYADVWEKGKCATRARLAREAGATRVTSAEVILAGADKNKIEALTAQQKQLNAARKAYIDEAKANQELSAEDKADLAKNLMPKAQKLVTDTANLVKQVTDLFNQVRQQANPSAMVGGLSGCATTGDKPAAEDSVSQLLSPVTSLLSLVKGLAENAQGLVSDVTTLAE
jgi:hypothetical protein